MIDKKAAELLVRERIAETKFHETHLVSHVREILGIGNIRSQGFVELLPFSLHDATAGSETELQAAVIGHKDKVDLPLVIQSSNYFANIARRAARGETSKRAVADLEKWIENNREEVWENSWVRFPTKLLSGYAKATLLSDLRADKRKTDCRLRTDVKKFFFQDHGEECLRVPISYLMRISLAHLIGCQPGLPLLIHETASAIMDRLLNDNTSPETLSFYVVQLRPETGFGEALAKETLKRFLLTHLLVMHANEAFGLKETGQRSLIYFSPHPPIRQKHLNECISDSFYRELFMSPCLSGWDNGEAKHEYMCLCHEVLSRSQLNAVSKLREAGIITRNLVVIPNLSNISLANNGTHVNLGSVRLSTFLKDETSGFTSAHEKYVGDLVTKIVEHFLPLFVGTYSAAPYRIDFADFHPEQVLGFLPHQLDYTHLRMIWRRWQSKAKLRILGQPTSPFGLRSLDRALSTLFRLKGDYIPDFRLIDYLVTPMSTYQSPALDGTPGNYHRLKEDLAELGIFHTKMSLYMLYRLREFTQAGFSGFEGRYYSVFESFEEDMAHAVNLQTLVTALAFQYVLSGAVTHADIPDDPRIESERRQIFFGAAIGLPTFFVRDDTDNRFLKRILHRTNGIRFSRRYPGYLRTYHRQFRIGLANTILTDGAELVEMLGLRRTMEDLMSRLDDSENRSTEGKLRRGILQDLNAKTPLDACAKEFNIAAEQHYRTTLKRGHIEEAFNILAHDLLTLESNHHEGGHMVRAALHHALGNQSPSGFLETVRHGVLNDTLPLHVLLQFINLVLISIHQDAAEARGQMRGTESANADRTSIHRAGNW